jgi:hypothetical protein
VTLEIPVPPEGEGPWKYALVGQTLADTSDGKDLIERLQTEGVLVEVLIGGDYAAQFQPQVPREAQLRAFQPDAGIVKPEDLP